VSGIQSGDVVRIGRAASVQFAGDRALTMRVMTVPDVPTYHGWMWLAGYVLDERGQAVGKREVFVQRAGVKILQQARTPAQRRPGQPVRRPT
jgi:hypothetical protein